MRILLVAAGTSLRILLAGFHKVCLCALFPAYLRDRLFLDVIAQPSCVVLCVLASTSTFPSVVLFCSVNLTRWLFFSHSKLRAGIGSMTQSAYLPHTSRVISGTLSGEVYRVSWGPLASWCSLVFRNRRWSYGTILMQTPSVDAL